MQVVDARCAGLDVHKKTVVACWLTPGPGAEPVREVRYARGLTAFANSI